MVRSSSSDFASRQVNITASTGREDMALTIPYVRFWTKL